MNAFNEHALEVGLPKVDFEPQCGASLQAAILDHLQRLVAIDVRFTFAEPIEIGSVENIDYVRHVTKAPVSFRERSAEGRPPPQATLLALRRGLRQRPAGCATPYPLVCQTRHPKETGSQASRTSSLRGSRQK